MRVALSQNGYHAASGPIMNCQNVGHAQAGGTGSDGDVRRHGSVHDLSCDHYGKYVAACGNTGVDVYAVKVVSATSGAAPRRA